MPPVSPPPYPGRLLRAVAGRGWPLTDLPKLDHVLLVADQAPDAKSAINFAIELVEHLHPQLTLLYGGNLRSPPPVRTDDFRDDSEQNQARLALLGLLWEIRKGWPEVGLCTGVPHSHEEVFEAAAQHEVDLVVLPESLFGPFLSQVDNGRYGETVTGAPCPVLVLEDHARHG
ncbi:MAG: universal stress protein [Verrucomicrobia bacterium]|nr:universal stress protein [Verrucomicrobiota bacterium]